MRLSVEELAGWAQDFYTRTDTTFRGKVNWTRLATDAGFTPVRLRAQRFRKEMDAQTIINVARNHGINPLDELARIGRWKHLTSSPSTPSKCDVLCSLHPQHIYREISDRLGKIEPYQRDLGTWGSHYGRFSTWIEITGSATSKKRLSDALNLASPSAVSNRLNSHTGFGADEVIDGFTAAGMDPVYALVLAGFITDEEAGYSRTLRHDVLLSATADDLLFMTQRQMRYTTKILAGSSADRRRIGVPE